MEVPAGKTDINPRQNASPLFSSPSLDPRPLTPLATDTVDPHRNPTSSDPLDASPLSRKRRRRRKQFPGMVPSLRYLRCTSPADAPTPAPMADDARPRRPRRRLTLPSSSSRLTRELDLEALIASAVGFPVDSLTEEEIESGVVPVVGGANQSNYIVVRNHVLSRWRSVPSTAVTAAHALQSIRSAHAPLVSSALSFLSSYAFINFGPIPSLRPSLPPPSAPSVIIVGAGLAGLGAARQLLSLGLKVLILEGRQRAGGRVMTRKMSGSGGSNVSAAADLGGSVLTGINGNPLGVIARQLGLPLHKVRDKCPLYLPDGRPVDPAVDARLEAAFNCLLDKVCKLRTTILEEFKSVDFPLGAALEAFRKAHGVAQVPEERMLLDWHLANLEYANAAKLSDLSMAFWDQDDPYEMGGDHCFIPGGNSRFVHTLAEDIPIFYGLTVRLVQYGCDGVMIYTEDGQVFQGDMALCTVPLGVLKKGTIEFVPPLPPHKQDAIERLGFGLLNKVAMLFPFDFWNGDELDTFGHLTEDPINRGEFFLFYSYTSVSGGPLLVALVAGASAVMIESSSPAENVERVLSVLRDIFAPKGIEVPAPVQVVCTRWGSDRFTYGSYSYVAIGSSGDDYDVLAESVGHGRVFFAGEATNRRYPATMHGALVSGFREAANMARAAKRRSTVPPQNGVDAKDKLCELDELFQCPDQSFGSFSVLYDPDCDSHESFSLVRVGIGERKMGSGSLFLYGLISRKHVLELGDISGDDNRLGILYRKFGTKLVGKNGLGSVGEAFIKRIMATREMNLKKESHLPQT